MADFRESKKDSGPSISEPPTFRGLELDLQAIIESRRNSRRTPYPACLPLDPADAVSWFIKVLPGQHHSEAVREVPTSKGQKYWVWPYADRMKNLVKKFFAADTELQNLVVAASQDRIGWRGDDMKTFLLIIEETEEMHRIGVDAYRKQARPRIRAMIMKMRGSAQPAQQDVEANRQAAMDYVEAQA